MSAENAPAPAESAQQSMTFDQAAEAALASGEESAAAAVTQEAAALQEGEAVEAPVSAPDVPEHVRWAKSVSGNADDQGNLIPDRLAKQAFELNKQYQPVVQRLAQLEKVLQHPRILAAMNELNQPAPSPTKQDAAEKTDEQILQEFVDKQIEERTAPLKQQAALAYQRAIQAETETAYVKLCEEFGKEQYDGIAPQIGAQMQAASQQSGIPVQQLIEFLVQRGQLYSTFEAAARSHLYPQLRDQVKKVQETASQQKLEEKKRTTVVPAKGVSAASVTKAAPKIESFEDAIRAAEEELAAKAK